MPDSQVERHFCAFVSHFCMQSSYQNKEQKKKKQKKQKKKKKQSKNNRNKNKHWKTFLSYTFSLTLSLFAGTCPLYKTFDENCSGLEKGLGHGILW